MDIMKNTKIVLCPTFEIAMVKKAEFEAAGLTVATVEAEYGSRVVFGTEKLGDWATLVHHGAYSNNAAPCIWNEMGFGNIAPIVPDVIIVSHLDLDTEGGVGLQLGYYNAKEQDFWKAAAFIDVNGPHHVGEVSEDARKKLQAYWANNEKARTRFSRDEATDITDVVKQHFEVLEKIMHNDPELINAGQRWNEEVTTAVNNCLVYESPNIRAFAGAMFTASSYCGADGIVRPCTVSLNTKTKAITLAFEDGGLTHNACEIMQELFGPEAGGRAGIAGTPRGFTYNVLDLAMVIQHVESLFN